MIPQDHSGVYALNTSTTGSLMMLIDAIRKNSLRLRSRVATSNLQSLLIALKLYSSSSGNIIPRKV